MNCKVFFTFLCRSVGFFAYMRWNFVHIFIGSLVQFYYFHNGIVFGLNSDGFFTLILWDFGFYRFVRFFVYMHWSFVQILFGKLIQFYYLHNGIVFGLNSDGSFTFILWVQINCGIFATVLCRLDRFFARIFRDFLFDSGMKLLAGLRKRFGVVYRNDLGSFFFFEFGVYRCWLRFTSNFLPCMPWCDRYV